MSHGAWHSVLCIEDSAGYRMGGVSHPVRLPDDADVVLSIHSLSCGVYGGRKKSHGEKSVIKRETQTLLIHLPSYGNSCDLLQIKMKHFEKF